MARSMEGGEFGVGGEAEGDDLGHGEGLGAGEVGCGKEGRRSGWTLFEADDAVLILGGVTADAGGEHDWRTRDMTIHQMDGNGNVWAIGAGCSATARAKLRTSRKPQVMKARSLEAWLWAD